MKVENGYTLSRRNGLVTIRLVRGQIAVKNAKANGLTVYSTDRAAKGAALRMAGRDGAICWDRG